MRKRIAPVIVSAICALALVAHFVIAGIKDSSLCQIVYTANDPLSSALEFRHGLNYLTGFEPGEGFPLGYIGNAPSTWPAGCGGTAFPCWGHTTAANASLITPTISNAHPFMGVQHLRLTHDPATRTNQLDFGLGIDARFPRDADLSVRPSAANTASVEIAISSPGGMNYRIQTQSNSVGCLATSALFMYDGSIWILDDQCGAAALQFMETGTFWDTTGAYRNYTVAMDPCIDRIYYFYEGAVIYSGCVIAGMKLEQFLVYGDNYPDSYVDVDNVRLSSNDGCPDLCGNGIVELPNEQCESFNQPTGCNPGHACNWDCTCSRVCTLAEPCELHNGDNGPFYAPFDSAMRGYFVYQAPPDVEAFSVETCGTTGVDSHILYFGSCSDPGDPGSSNDDCCDPSESACGTVGSGSDPSASCYNNVSAPNLESCTCHDNPLPGDNCYLLIVDNLGHCKENLDARWMITVNKKAVCGEGHLGSCCDTNGADTGCTDNVLSSACQGADKVWTENGKCESVSCSCIPDCTGAVCGSDGCGGSCGSCDDGNVCNGVETCGPDRTCMAGTPLQCNDGNACNGIETCAPFSGCVPGTPLHCDDGVACNGLESCNPSSGCVAGTPVNCDDGIDCTVDACNEPDGSCSHDDADCAIPTVSEWGLLVLALLLLTTAKLRLASPIAKGG